jgi:hypothetical protein
LVNMGALGRLLLERFGGLNIMELNTPAARLVSAPKSEQNGEYKGSEHPFFGNNPMQAAKTGLFYSGR